VRKEPFCPVAFATRLAERARAAGAGTVFSLATVFACMEFESWMLACLDRLAGTPFPDGRSGIRPGTPAPEGDLERAPRDAKGWLDDHIDAGYKPTRDQEPLTRLMVNHLDAVRQRGSRSFRRLENALRLLVNAIRDNAHIVSPGSPAPSGST
jgi:hypothetical protein